MHSSFASALIKYRKGNIICKKQHCADLSENQNTGEQDGDQRYYWLHFVFVFVSVFVFVFVFVIVFGWWSEELLSATLSQHLCPQGCDSQTDKCLGRAITKQWGVPGQTFLLRPTFASEQPTSKPSSVGKRLPENFKQGLETRWQAIPIYVEVIVPQPGPGHTDIRLQLKMAEWKPWKAKKLGLCRMYNFGFSSGTKPSKAGLHCCWLLR